MSNIAKQLSQGLELAEGQVVLGLSEYRIGLRSNSHELLEKLGVYFAHTLDAGEPDIEVIAYETAPQDLGLDFIDWKREPGKTGRKDAYVDVEDGRLVQKVRTGMVFLQSETHRIAAGPCLANDNQVINFINAQYMNWLQNNGELICHASGLVVDARCLGIAGFSGGGKSTLMLKVLDDDNVHYLTNDRLFIAKDNTHVRATGIPKLPRINPGTIVHNEKLKSILSPEQQEHFLSMPNEELWHIEDKYDVDVEDVYGEGKIAPTAKLKAFLVLNWTRDGETPCTFTQVDLAKRPELLERAIMKSPGPFYQFADGSFLQDDMPLDPAPYLDMLKDIPIFEVSGTIDFDAATQFCLEQMKG
ncbi:HprK-related kinase B [Magnetovibrio sp. PR-2]|uniref:HprK-related kinase B n=1 Tax=Magnetovibrio sp. PR-2 TaxID=3120356 RepID=UPI002FCDF550